MPSSNESDLHNEQYNPAAENKSVDPENERSGNRGVQQVIADGVGKPVADNSGATIVFENTSPQISLTSGADGSYTSPVLSSGYYNLNISKPGYGPMELVHFQHTGGVNVSEAGLTMLGKKPSSFFDIQNLKVDTVTDNGFHYMYITITLAHPQVLPYTWAVVYFRHVPGAGNAHNDYTYRTVFYQLDPTTLAF